MSLFKSLMEQLERLRAAYVESSFNALNMEVKALIMNADEKEDFHNSVTSCGIPVFNKVASRWTRHFMFCHGIVLECRAGKLMLSPTKEKLIKMSVAFHPEKFKRRVVEGSRQKNLFSKNIYLIDQIK